MQQLTFLTLLVNVEHKLISDNESFRISQSDTEEMKEKFNEMYPDFSQEKILKGFKAIQDLSVGFYKTLDAEYVPVELEDQYVPSFTNESYKSNKESILSVLEKLSAKKYISNDAGGMFKINKKAKENISAIKEAVELI